MNPKNYQYLYGPVSSWRLGRSLGIDPISAREKICTFDCVYCQLGRTRVLMKERRIFIPLEDLLREVMGLPKIAIDYITFSGAGEPTLAANLGEMIRGIKKVRPEKIAVITNASLLSRDDVRRDLLRADFILAKLDASSSPLFKKMNRPLEGICFKEVVQGLKDLRSIYKGRLALQMMFGPGNVRYASRMAALAQEICPDEIQMNTPLRPCAINPLPETMIDEIEAFFKKKVGDGIAILNVFKGKTKKTQAISSVDTLRRRGKVSGF